MRYNTFINNVKAIEWGLNANQSALFDLLNQASSWAKEIIMDNEVFYFVARSKVIEELPLFYEKEDTVYRHLKALSDKGLVTYKKLGNMDLVKLTSKGKGWNDFKSDYSEINPNNLGTKSESSSEINPTYNNTSSNNKTKDNKIELPSFISQDVWAKWEKHRKELKKKLTTTTIEQQFKKLSEWKDQGHSPDAIILNAIDKGWYGLYLPNNFKSNGVNMMQVNGKDYYEPFENF